MALAFRPSCGKTAFGRSEGAAGRRRGRCSSDTPFGLGSRRTSSLRPVVSQSLRKSEKYH
jgi:hypothetical protein